MSEALFVIILAAMALGGTFMYLSRRGQIQPQKPDPTQYVEGLKAVLRGQDEQAFIKLKEAVSLDTNNVDAYIRMGNILRRGKKPEQALQIHRDLTFRQNLPGDVKQEILIALYHDFMELKDESSALKAIGEVLEMNASDRFALSARLRAHEKAGEWKEAAAVRRRLDKLDGQDSGHMLALYKLFEGDDLNRQNDRHRARLFYKEAIHLDKACLAAYLAIGDSYYTENRLEDALRYWTKVITLKPDLGQLVFDRLKKGFFEVGRYGEYADALTGLLQACPDHLTARLELAYFLEKKGEMDAARDHYTTALDNHTDSMLAKLGLYRLNRALGKREAADGIFKQIMKMAARKETGRYHCRSCGLETETIAWQCPRCKAVDSFDSVKS